MEQADECSGLILDESNDWLTVARTYERFFSEGLKCAKKIDWMTAKVIQFVANVPGLYLNWDGLLAVMYPHKGFWFVSCYLSADGSEPSFASRARDAN